MHSLSHLCRALFTCAELECVSARVQRALENDPISQRKFERLNLGLSTFATLNILLLVTSLVSPEGSVQYPARYLNDASIGLPHPTYPARLYH